jgi:hypothetical protein
MVSKLWLVDVQAVYSEERDAPPHAHEQGPDLQLHPGNSYIHLHQSTLPTYCTATFFVSSIQQITTSVTLSCSLLVVSPFLLLPERKSIV